MRIKDIKNKKLRDHFVDKVLEMYELEKTTLTVKIALMTYFMQYIMYASIKNRLILELIYNKYNKRPFRNKHGEVGGWLGKEEHTLRLERLRKNIK